MFVEFVIQNQYFSLSLEDFAQILRIPCKGACVFSDRWSLDELVYGAPSEGSYQTNLPFPDDIILYNSAEEIEKVTSPRISVIKKKFEVQESISLVKLLSTLKPLEEKFRKMFFCLGG
ncbi:hypothetical protein Tco_0531245 [Tanacetum coccineum]